MLLEGTEAANTVADKHGKATMRIKTGKCFMQRRPAIPLLLDGWIHILMTLILLVSALGIGGCGKKGPPVAPHEKPTPAVNDLKGYREGERIVLAWHLPADFNHQAGELDGFRVYRSKQLLDMETCKGCPLLFERVAAIPLDRAQKAEPDASPFQYSDTIEKGYRYIYKVVSLRSAAFESSSSNLVEIVYE